MKFGLWLSVCGYRVLVIGFRVGIVVLISFFILSNIILAKEKGEPKGFKLTPEKISVASKKIVYRFKDKEDMQEFEKMYKQNRHQQIRIEVLKNLLEQETKRLEELDAKMYLKFMFNLQQDKKYELDRASLTIYEIVEPEKIEQKK